MLFHRGSNTFHAEWPGVSSWVEWTDFNARLLYEMFKDTVNLAWNDPPREVDLTKFDREVWDEDSLEHLLGKAIMPPVNAALSKVRHSRGLHKDFDLDLGRAGRATIDLSNDTRIRPDWALCSKQFRDGYYSNLLPGDTKLSRKWQSNFFPEYDIEWRDPVRQIVHYCDNSESRYGFLITDEELVVVRCRREMIEDSAMVNRPHRGPQRQEGHYRQISSSDTSEMMQNTSLGSYYQATNSGVDFHPVQFRAIPWKNHGDGKNQLTVRLALFYLSMMAASGFSNIQNEYPPFDSWSYTDAGYVHNTTGEVVKKKPRGASLRCPDPSAAGPLMVMGEDGRQFLTRSSARTLDIDEQREQYYYDDASTNTRVYIDTDMVIYDEEAREYGFFRCLEWVREGDRHKSASNRRRKR